MPHRLQTKVRRVSPGKERHEQAETLVYWMHRSHRVKDNWGLLWALTRAAEQNIPMAVVHVTVAAFLQSADRNFAFLQLGLDEVGRDLARLGIPFFRLTGNPGDEIGRFCEKHKAHVVVTDFDPLHIKRQWIDAVVQSGLEVWEADSRNLVPCWVTSGKKEYAARTIRPKIHRLLPEYLLAGPAMPEQPTPWPHDLPQNKVGTSASLPSGLSWRVPGESAAHEALIKFIDTRLDTYAERSSNPVQESVSRLSPYLHFGMLSMESLAVAASQSGKKRDGCEGFLEQSVVRRELSDNFCQHEPDYDSTACFPDWAERTLADHANDEREYLYAREELEAGKTHDPLWNAAQRALVDTGFMHNYLRMYWAKKILEWSPNVADAMETAIYLNDTWSLDGRDSNGYTGIAWSMGGIHDRPWAERPIFGKIRYMNYNGASRKFDVNAYVRSVEQASLFR